MHQPDPADVRAEASTGDYESSAPKQPWSTPILDVLALGETLAGPGIPGDGAGTGAS